MEKVRLGVIGFGSMGSEHCVSISSGQVNNMVIGAICDIAEERLEEAKKLYPDVPVFKDADELFKSGTCDAVIV